MPEFIKGRDLCRDFYHEVAKPILDDVFPTLRYSAGLLGYGSDVLGFDDETSTDHMWGPRFYLFLSDADYALKERILDVFSRTLPHKYKGYSVHFSLPDPNDNGVQHAEDTEEGPVNSLIFIYTPEGYLQEYMGTFDLDHLTVSDWLSFSEHRLLALSRAEFYRDDLHCGDLLAKLRSYPETVWTYLVASNWSLLAEEQAFVKRTAAVGDELGSILICGRIAERLMRLCFLYCRQYAPYSKWFGTAFNHLPVSDAIKRAIHGALTASNITEREMQLVQAQKLVADLHDTLGITAPVHAEIQSYFGRDIRVIFADRIAEVVAEKLTGTALDGLPLIGALSQVANFTALSDDPVYRDKIRRLYE
ncbi:MAG: DUF4037 domain-containing protein [Clostridia bacterium]|nr:DUF4037 domain-containing protein [Clostridia bacterium]